MSLATCVCVVPMVTAGFSTCVCKFSSVHIVQYSCDERGCISVLICIVLPASVTTLETDVTTFRLNMAYSASCFAIIHA